MNVLNTSPIFCQHIGFIYSFDELNVLKLLGLVK